MAVINWNTVPDYDEWGVDTWWNCQDWIMWHKRLVEHFNKPTAKEIWNYAYAKSGSLSGNLDCRTFNTDFRKYVRENGLSPYEGAGVFTPVLQGYGTASDIVSGGLDTVSNVSSGVFGGLSSILGGDGFKKTVSVIAIVGGVIGIAYAYNAFKK
jgi:hypothetical protein